jgi:transposase
MGQFSVTIYGATGSALSDIQQAAFMYTLIVTAKMNDIDPQAWLADVLKRLPDMPVSRVHELLPWNWKTALAIVKAA